MIDQKIKESMKIADMYNRPFMVMVTNYENSIKEAFVQAIVVSSLYQQY